MVTVTHGPNCDSLFVVGESVEAVHSGLATAFNVPPDAVAFVNGRKVDSTYLLEANDILEFCQHQGRKGVDRMFTEEDIRREYTGIPPEVLDDVVAHFPHDDRNVGGENIWLESSIDQWLSEQYSRKRADDGCDRVLPPDEVRINGTTYDNLTSLEWRLLEILLSKGQAVLIDDVIQHMWGHDAGDKDEALKQQLKRLNKRLAAERCPAVITKKNGYVTLTK